MIRIRTRVCLALVVIAASAGRLSVSGQVFNPATGNYYFDVPISIEITDARALAQAAGGTLVAINDAAENAWLASEFPGAYRWIGLSDEISEGAFLWDSGQPFTYSDWAPGEPSASSPLRDYVRRGFNGWSTVLPSDIARPLVETPMAPLPAITGLVCASQGVEVLLSWTPGPYDQVRVYRDQALVALVPGGSGSYVDSPAPGTYFYLVTAQAGASLSIPVTCYASAAHPDYLVHVDGNEALSNGETTFRVLLDATGTAVQGYSLGICFDESDAEIGGWTEGTASSAPPISGADFFQVNFYGGFPSGVAVGMVASFSGGLTLPVGVDLELVIFDVAVALDAPATIPLEVCNTLGLPPVQVTIVIAGVGYVPLQTDGAIEVVPARFVRADCNSSGDVNLSDVIFLGERLFSPEADSYPCFEACEANGDGAIDIADMIYTLSYLFVAGPPPTAPFPICDFDPRPETAHECLSGLSCP